jgi:hypothetical protein
MRVNIDLNKIKYNIIITGHLGFELTLKVTQILLSQLQIQ